MSTIKIVLRDKPNKEGLYPIVFKITKERKTKIITLGMDCLKHDWNAKSSEFKKSYPNYLQRNRALDMQIKPAVLVKQHF